MSDAPLLVSLDSVRAAASSLEGVALRTPVVEVEALSRMVGVRVGLKCEQLQTIGAFKLRGAYTALFRLPPEERARGVVSHSSGNHGQAVAYAARLLGIEAVIVMPETAPRVKVEGVRRYGAEVVFVGPTAPERQAKADELAKTRGLAPVSPYENSDVIAGQATCGLEIVEQWPEVDTILVPVGGGGLLAGITTAALAVKATIRMVGVEPAGAPKLSAAVAAGRPVSLAKAESIADGLLPLSVGWLPYAHFGGRLRDVVPVSDEEIIRAMRFLSEEADLRVEPSGAATTAALLAGRLRPGGPTVAVVSGGNVDPDLFQRLVG